MRYSTQKTEQNSPRDKLLGGRVGLSERLETNIRDVFVLYIKLQNSNETTKTLTRSKSWFTIITTHKNLKTNLGIRVEQRQPVVKKEINPKKEDAPLSFQKKER